MGINCSIFLYRNSFGAKQRLALARKSFGTGTGFTLCSSAGLAVGECFAVMGLTPCMLCVQIYCVACIGLLSPEFSSLNTGLGRPTFWKHLYLLSTHEGLAATNY